MQTGQQLAQLFHRGTLQSQPESQLARLKRPQAGGRVNGGFQNCFRVLPRHFFDLHPAGGGGHHHHPRQRPVQHQTEVEFARNRERFLHQHAAHDAARGAGLRRHQRLAQQSGCVLLGLLRSGCHADAAAFAAPAGVNLGLYYCFAAQLFRRSACLRGTERHFALRHGDAVAGKNLLGLILVYFHARCLPDWLLWKRNRNRIPLSRRPTLRV